MSRIDVIQNGDEFKVLFNCIQQGVTLHNAEFANHEAIKLKEKHYPKAELHLHSEGTIKLRKTKSAMKDS